jgi:hypothetical protein
MTLNELKKLKPIPGFDCVEMKHHAQERIRRETAGMSVQELIAYYNCAGRAFWETGKIPTAGEESVVVHDDPPGEKP